MITKVMNLFAGPGAGKSTTAAGLFFNLERFNKIAVRRYRAIEAEEINPSRRSLKQIGADP